MGTEITLEIAKLTVDWCKNSRGNNHRVLFQEIDRKRFDSHQIDYGYFLMKMGFSRKLKDILPRLDLLGFTKEQARREYFRVVEACREEDHNYSKRFSAEDGTIVRDLMSFEEFCTFVAAHPIESLDNSYDHRGIFSSDTAIERIPCPSSHEQDGYSERSYFGSVIGFLQPYSILRLLAENAQNRDTDVVWQYGPLVENGWAEEAEFMSCAKRNQKFLIATEGSSDVHIIKHAISILRPDIEDFFYFIDVSVAHPFSGAGSLVKFAEGLAKIDVHNQVVFIFDNDGEGFDACQRIKKLSLPSNMRAIMLPELDEFRAFPARGPQGVINADINKRAAAIECYLDLKNARGSSPQVVWTNYKKDIDIYQGALESKEEYTKFFLKQTAQSIDANSYDVSKLNAVLDALTTECTSIAESTLQSSLWSN